MNKNITLTEAQYLRLIELTSALEEQAVLFSWTSLQYTATLKIIAAGLKEILEKNQLIDHLTEAQYQRLIELTSALEEQAVLFSWTSLQYGTTLKIIAAGFKEVLEGNQLIDDLLEEVDQTLTDRPRAKAAAS